MPIGWLESALIDPFALVPSDEPNALTYSTTSWSCPLLLTSESADGHQPALERSLFL
jgi:hypothetical protein